jgi:hypothetical protein
MIAWSLSSGLNISLSSSAEDFVPSHWTLTSSFSLGSVSFSYSISSNTGLLTLKEREKGKHAELFESFYVIIAFAKLTVILDTSITSR